jgi:hypothetical protein
MKVSIHQPNFMPWPGFFNKIIQSDIFVILDDVKCSKNSFFNRSKFASGKNTFWLTVPLAKKSYSLKIYNAETPNKKWIDKHIKYFENTHGATQERKFYNTIIEEYERLRHEDCMLISDFNISLIQNIVDFLEIDSRIVKSSELNIPDRFLKQDRVIEIVKKMSGKTYISGKGAREYQDREIFVLNNIDLEYNNFNPDPFQLSEGENVSIVDFILREGIWKTKKLLISD